jgi:hypothetical protein
MPSDFVVLSSVAKSFTFPFLWSFISLFIGGDARIARSVTLSFHSESLALFSHDEVQRGAAALNLA